MIPREEIARRRERARAHLEEELLPFWIGRSPDPEHGGFLTWFDRDGRPTGETSKTFLAQVRLLFALSAAQRAGYGGDRCAQLAAEAVQFLTERYWDPVHGGWFWIGDRDGCPTDERKVGYGHAFAMYAFAERSLASGDPLARAWMERSYEVVMSRMADPAHGGWLELFSRDWTPLPPEEGGDRKSFDVHLHLMEGLTSVFEVTRSPHHERALRASVAILLERVLDADSGAGGMQFAPDWTPLPAASLGAVWGRDEAPEDGVARPLDLTNYGHDIECAWLLLRAADVLGEDRSPWAERLRATFEHTLAHGLDREHGGLFLEGPRGGEPAHTRKQFWQQAEGQIGFLDAWALYGEDRWFEAFASTQDFALDRLANHDAGGEWRLLVERDGTPIWDELGTGWKLCYHTVRGQLEVLRRLDAALSA